MAVDTGVGEGGPEVIAIAGHGVVEAAVPEQAEVGHPGFTDGHALPGGQGHPAAADQVRGQAVDRLQHRQSAQGHRHAPGRCRPGRVLVVGAVVGMVGLLTADERGFALVLKVDEMVVVQGEALPVFLG